MTEILDKAIEYAEMGWFVLPVQVKNKNPFTRFAKKGHWSATNDIQVIEDWWEEIPNLNVGIFCERSELIVVDVDFKRMGVEAWECYMNKLPDTYVVATGFGMHFYYRITRGLWMPSQLCDGIDIKYRGYVVAPPSIHPNGYAYTSGEQSPHNDMAHVPDFILELGDVDVTALR